MIHYQRWCRAFDRHGADATRRRHPSKPRSLNEDLLTGKVAWTSKARDGRGCARQDEKLGLGSEALDDRINEQYESKIRERNILMAVHTEDSTRRERAIDILERGGAHDIASIGDTSVPRARTAAAAAH